MIRFLSILAVVVYVSAVAGAWYVSSTAQAAAPVAVKPPGGQEESEEDDSGNSNEVVAAGRTGNATAVSAEQGPVAPLNNGPNAFINGFAINLHHTDDVQAFYRAIDDVAKLGFNSVEIVTPAFQLNGASTKIALEVGPGKSPRREDLTAVLNYARKKGLKTVLMPIVLFKSPRGNEWRGKIQPEHWEPWWASYREIMDYFTDIANETGVSVLSVGSELLSTEKQGDQWGAEIAHIRSRFSGKLSYSTNWDHYHVPVFWKSLDMIGINGYWDLTTMSKKTPPEEAELVDRWKEIRDQVMTFGKSEDRPVMLTEIGYPSLPWGLKDPWNYVNGSDTKSTPETQEEGYRAFLVAWSDLIGAKPDPKQLTGVFFYKWDPYGDGSSSDTGYGVKGKPVYELIKKWQEQRQK
jgi:hypothetical protein